MTWTQIIAAAPVGMLTAIDYPAVIAYAMGIREYDRFARRIAARKTPAPPPLARQLRLLAAELRAARKDLGLPAYDRGRIALPPPPPELADNPHLRSVTLVEAGKVRGVYRWAASRREALVPAFADPAAPLRREAQLKAGSISSVTRLNWRFWWYPATRSRIVVAPASTYLCSL